VADDQVIPVGIFIHILTDMHHHSRLTLSSLLNFVLFFSCYVRS
jgi:hypothetical protein